MRGNKIKKMECAFAGSKIDMRGAKKYETNSSRRGRKTKRDG